MKAAWLVSVIVFLICVTAGYRVRQYNQPHIGELLPLPSRVSLKLVQNTSGSKPPRIEQTGVFLMSANAARRSLTSIQKRLTTELQSGGSIRCDDKIACEWLGSTSDRAGPDDAALTVATSQSWPGEVTSEIGQLPSNQVCIVHLPNNISSNDRLVAGIIQLGDQPVSVTSTNTRRDHLLASNDVDALVVAPLTKKPTAVHFIVGQSTNNSGQVFIDLNQTDNMSFAQTVIKYGALVGLVLAMFGRHFPIRTLVGALTWVLLSAGLMTLAYSVYPVYGIGGILIASVLSLTLCILGQAFAVDFAPGMLLACLLGDVITGGYLGTFAGVGANPVIGARYYGLGNELSALLFASLLCLLPSKSMLRIILLGGVALIVGHPSLGANGGDMIAVLIATGMYSVMRGGRKSIILAVITLLAMACVILWDAFLAPESMQSHIGRLVESMGTGFADVISSKIAAHFRLMTSSSWGVTSLISILWWVRQHIKNADRKIDLCACVAACLFLFNDSGPVSLTLFTLVMIINRKPDTFMSQRGWWETKEYIKSESFKDDMTPERIA